MVVVTAEEMRALDQWTIAHGTPGHVLMERAGRGALAVLRPLLRGRRGLVLVICGHGNNGGDGLVIARLLRRAGRRTEVWLTADPERLRGDAARMLRAWRRGGGRVQTVLTANDLPAFRTRLEQAAVVVDAIFGTGLHSPVREPVAAVIAAINGAAGPVLAVDVPSGLSSDSGQVLGVAVRAAATATFAVRKMGLCLHPGVEYAGATTVVDIGIPDEALRALAPRGTLLAAGTVGEWLPTRPRDAHKGSFGHVAVLAGSRGKLGAALLAAEGVARAGAGLTTLIVPETLQPLAEGRVREVMTQGLPDDDGVFAVTACERVDTALDGYDAVVCGPGLGSGDGPRAFVRRVLERATGPVVLDADGLNAIAGSRALHQRRAPTVVTPHPGEMSRLTGLDTAAVQADRPAAARRFAAEAGVVCVLKGARTIIAGPDGRLAICPTGNPGMASGGSGDVLAGVVGGLLAQGLPLFEAAALAVYVHGAAADGIAARRGEVGLLARDLLGELPAALLAVQVAAHGTEHE
jgi:NAD(P)H-hydrate epimerase